MCISSRNCFSCISSIIAFTDIAFFLTLGVLNTYFYHKHMTMASSQLCLVRKDQEVPLFHGGIFNQDILE